MKEAVHTHAVPDVPSRTSGAALAGLYARTFAWYVIGVLLLWLLGVESIYGHPTPLYAAYLPVFNTLFVPLTMIGAAVAIQWHLRRALVLQPAARETLTAFAVALALALIAVTFWDARARGEAFPAALAGNLGLLAWHLPAAVVAAAGAFALERMLLRRDWFSWTPTPRERRWFLFGVWLFLVLFSASIAMMRGGLNGISQAYARETYEYIGDIGKTPGIRALFARYTEIHEFLSMHAKVHPPGPIVLLWMLSWVAGRGAFLLSVATILAGSATVVPLYFWARGLFGEAAARTACLLYALVPSVVLFTATSTDILFTPFTLGALCLFDRALDRNSPRDAFLAGTLYGIMSIISFSLVGVGAYFGLVGLWRCRHGEWRKVVRTAAVMLAAVALFHGLLYAWSGFDLLETFRLAATQFQLDQRHLDLVTPRLPAWTYRIWNPLTWFFFAGIPVSVLFLWRLARPHPAVRARVVIFFLTLLALNVLYLARGEGERSALYLFPFLVLPAAHLLHEMGVRDTTPAPLLVTCGCLAFQCWLIEAYFYTYW